MTDYGSKNKRRNNASRTTLFPPLLPDEALISACARYKDYLSPIKDRWITRELFSANHVTTSFDFPVNLTSFVKALPKGHEYSEDYLIDYHTLFSYYTFGLSSDRVTKLRSAMKGPDAISIHHSLGIPASPIPKLQYARYCPICLKEDVEKYGEPSWHRSHQIPGINACAEHAVWLENSNFVIRERSARYSLVPLRKATTQFELRHLDLSQPLDQHSLWLAKEAITLLNPAFPHIEPIDLRVRYKTLLAERGFAVFSGRLRIPELLEAFNKFYPPAFLNELGCQIDVNTNASWLLRNFRLSQERISPIQHLLVIRFLGHDLQSILAKVDKSEDPFGSGPWPCLNQVCPSYLKKVVLQVSIHHKYGEPVGEFRCPECGYTYGRGGPDTSEDDQFRKSKITDIGYLWKKRLADQLPIPHRRLRSTARELGVDPKTILRYAEILTRENYESMSKLKTRAIDPKERRKQWLDLTKHNPGLGVKALRKLSPATFTWLYRHDRVWLEQHKPAPVKGDNRSDLRVDWNQRDRAISGQIPAAVERIKSRSGKPIQVTKTAIGRELGILSLLEKHIDKLPLCSAVIEAAIEDRAMYALRRIERVIEECRRQGIILKRWEIVRKAGLERIEKWKRIESFLDTLEYS